VVEAAGGVDVGVEELVGGVVVGAVDDGDVVWDGGVGGDSVWEVDDVVGGVVSVSVVVAVVDEPDGGSIPNSPIPMPRGSVVLTAMLRIGLAVDVV
jgi:hypothetical protein